LVKIIISKKLDNICRNNFLSVYAAAFATEGNLQVFFAERLLMWTISKT